MLSQLLLAALAVAAPQETVTQESVPQKTDEPAPVVQVFLLAGQSNMVGHGVVDLDDPQDYNGGRGNLAHVLAEPGVAARFANLRDDRGVWTLRDDVFVSFQPDGHPSKAGPLSIGYAVRGSSHHFGPELMFGVELGEHFDEPVLLIKTAWGGKSLARDFRPPSAGGEVGPYYTRMLAEYRDTMAHLSERFPSLAGHEPELRGFVWFQGWNDMIDDDATAQYASNFRHLVGDLRRELGAPDLPVVIGETGNCDNEEFRAAQRAAGESPELAGTAAFVPTFAFRRAAEDSPNTGHSHHWFGNAESYLLVGEALGQAMVGLLEPSARADQQQPARTPR